MTAQEHRNEYWRDVERRRAAERKANAVMNWTLIALGLAALAFILWLNKTQPLRERAAYLEGRWDLDPATAMAFARAEFARADKANAAVDAALVAKTEGGAK